MWTSQARGPCGRPVVRLLEGLSRGTTVLWVWAVAGSRVLMPTGAPTRAADRDPSCRRPDGSFSCANTPAKTVLTGELSPNDPKVVARATALANELGEPVAYSDGRTTRTFFPDVT